MKCKRGYQTSNRTIVTTESHTNTPRTAPARIGFGIGITGKIAHAVPPFPPWGSFLQPLKTAIKLSECPLAHARVFYRPAQLDLVLLAHALPYSSLAPSSSVWCKFSRSCWGFSLRPVCLSVCRCGPIYSGCSCDPPGSECLSNTSI